MWKIGMPAARARSSKRHFPNSFVQTDLELQLRAADVTHVILGGFQPTVVAAATATRDLPGSDEAVVAAPSIQAASLAALSDLFAVVVRTSEQIVD
jgi:nicotinamidase-related amidase